MKAVMVLALSIAVGLVLHGSAVAQGQEAPALYRVAMNNETILMEPDPQVPGRYTLYWQATVVIDARTPEPIKLTGTAALSPLGQWTPAPGIGFGTSSLVPGINTVVQKVPLGSIDLPQDGRRLEHPRLGPYFEDTQSVKVRLSVLRQGAWLGAPPLAEAKYELKPLGYALLEAAERGDDAEVRQLLQKGTDPDSGTVQKWTALMAAASRGQRNVVKLLLDQGAKVNARRNGFPFVTTQLGARFPSGETALMAACAAGDTETVRLLLEAKARVNYERHPDRWTALMAAAYGSHERIVRMLLNKGATVSAVTEWGYSPTALAAINGNAAIVRMLKARGDVIRVPWDELTRQ